MRRYINENILSEGLKTSIRRSDGKTGHDVCQFKLLCTNTSFCYSHQQIQHNLNPTQTALLFATDVPPCGNTTSLCVASETLDFIVSDAENYYKRKIV